MNKQIGLIILIIGILTGTTSLFAEWMEAPLPPEPPSDDLVPPASAPPEGGGDITEGTVVTTNETAITPELRSLARSLRHDPERIFEYVRNCIDYLPTYGIHVGAHGCYMAEKGNEWDQNALLIALLRESGYVCRYGYGRVRYNRSDLTEWLPVSQDQMDAYLARFGGYAGDVTGAPDLLYAYRLWTEVEIDSVWHRLDPSIKTYNSASIDIASAMNYNASALRNVALQGATIGTADVGNLNRQGIRNALTTYTTNLLTHLTAQEPGTFTDEVFGLRRIVPVPVEGLSVDLPLAVHVHSETLEFWDHIQAADQGTFRVRHGSIDHTFNVFELADRMLTLTYDAQNRPVLALDGVAVVTGSPLALGQRDLVINAHSPVHSQWTTDWLDQQKTQDVEVGGVYSLFHEFNSSGRKSMEASSRRLQKAVLTGGNTEQWTAVFEQMNHGYNYQRAQNFKLIGALWNSPLHRIFKFGVVGFGSGMYVDLPGGLAGTFPYGSDTFETQTLMGSALEHGVLEQYQKKPSVSTIGLLDINIENGGRIFLATPSTWSYVKSQIQSQYTSSRIASIEAGILNNSWQYILPETDQLTLNDWTGLGYVLLYSSGGVGMKIGGGFDGAHETTGAEPSGWLGTFLSWIGFGKKAGVNETTGADPVSMTTGSYLIDRTDLTLGNGQAPRGLSFRRHYRSDQSLTTGALGFGWQHGLQGSVRETTRPVIGWGGRTPADIAAQVVQNTVLVDVMAGDRDAVDWAVASVVTRWAMDQLTQNAVTVELGNRTFDYIRQPDGSYSAPPGVTSRLIKTNDVYVLKERNANTYIFNTNNLIAEIRDPDSNTMHFVYNTQTNLQTVTDAFGRSLTFSYNAQTNLQTVTDSTGRQISFGYTDGNLTTFTDPENNTWTYQYDADRQITAAVDPENITTIQNRYDPLGCVTQQIGAASGIWNFYIGGQQGAEEDPLGGVTIHTFDRDGRNLGTENALGYRTYNIYDGQGRLTTHVNARGATNLYVYDADHNLLSKTDAAGTSEERITTCGYDSLHRPVFVTNALGDVTTYQYDEEHHLLSVSNAAHRAELTYYDDGLLHEKTDGNNQGTEYFYDAYGNTRQIERPDGSVVSNLYNARGDLLTAWDGVGNKTEAVYDTNRQLLSTTDPRNNTAVRTWYDNGLLKTATDVGGRTNQYTHTPAYKPLVTIEPDGDAVSNFYDSADRLITVVTPGDRSTHYGLDAIGQRTNVQYPSTSIGYVFDANGNLVQRTDGKGQATAYDFDELNRLTNVVHEGTWKASFQYDFLGNNVEHASPLASVSFGYDEMNRLTNSKVQVSSFEFQVSSSYDLNGNRTNIVYPGGHSVSYSYDENNRIESVDLSDFGLSTFDFSYDSAGRMTNLVYPNGVTGSFVHNPNGRIIEYSYNDGTSNFLHHVMERNALGFKTVEDIYEGTVPNFTNELRQTRTHNEADQLLSAGTDAYSYDANGNLTNAAGDAYTWDHDNRLTSVSGGSGSVTTEYLYDASGARIGRTVAGGGDPGSTNYFVLDYKAPLKMPLAETDASGNITRYYIWSSHGLLCHLDVDPSSGAITSTRYYHPDEQGSTLALTDENGEVIDQFTYSPYGKVLNRTGSTDIPYQWLGALAVRNEGNGLYYMLNRYYSADMKRFISVDPKGISGGFNLYAYGNLNPLFYTDPFGMEASSWLSQVGGWIGSGATAIGGWIGGGAINAGGWISSGLSTISGLVSVGEPTWFNWSGEQNPIGREGRIYDLLQLSPTSKFTQWMGYIIPNAHEFGQFHDAGLGYLTGLGIPDPFVNWITMPPAYGATLIGNTIDTPNDIFDFFSQ